MRSPIFLVVFALLATTCSRRDEREYTLQGTSGDWTPEEILADLKAVGSAD